MLKITSFISEAYLEPSQTSMIQNWAKIWIKLLF